MIRVFDVDNGRQLALGDVPGPVLSVVFIPNSARFFLLSMAFFRGDLSVGKMRIAPVAMPVVAEVNFATSGPLQDTVVLGTTDRSLLFSSDAGKTFDRDKG